jgi:hypothetical protein
MTPNTYVSHLKNHGFLAGVKVVAWSLLLIVCVYGIVETPELWSTSSNDEEGSARIVLIPASFARTDETAAPAETQDGRALTLDERDDPSDGPRECLREKGISTDCIYD